MENDIDTEALRAAAEKALAEHPGARTCEAHPFRPKIEAVLLNDEENGIAEGDKAQIALCAAAQPQTILTLLDERDHLRRIADAAAAYRDAASAGALPDMLAAWSELCAALDAKEFTP